MSLTQLSRGDGQEWSAKQAGEEWEAEPEHRSIRLGLTGALERREETPCPGACAPPLPPWDSGSPSRLGALATELQGRRGMAPATTSDQLERHRVQGWLPPSMLVRTTKGSEWTPARAGYRGP